MLLTEFYIYDDMATKEEKCRAVLNQLRTAERVEASCMCYAASKEMARTLVSMDTARIIAMIEVHAFFLRVYRADLNGFRFGAVINDVAEKMNRNQND